METGFVLAGLSLAAFGLSYAGVAGLRRWAERRQVLDIPNERSSHTRPTPRGGGLGIVGVTLAGAGLLWLARPLWPLTEFLSFVVGAAIIVGVSGLDDLRPLPNRIRFAVHSAAAVIAIAGIGYWRVVELPWAGRLEMGWVGLPVTFLWIVGLTNAYNFMDGIDGLAGGQAVAAGLGWGVLGWLSDQPFVAAIGLLLAASSLGFLSHNWPPAHIFMGDVGSAFLGYTFAVLSVVAAQTHPALALAGVLVVWPFIFDTTFTFLRRLRRRENIFRAHRSHLYQRLVIAGRSHTAVTSLYLGLALLGGLAGVAWAGAWPAADVMLLLIPVIGLGVWVGVVWSERQAASVTIGVRRENSSERPSRQ